jgi:hypothetical protein
MNILKNLIVYAKYIDIPNWESLRTQIIDFKNKFTPPPPETVWWCHFEEEVKKEIPDLVDTFNRMNLTMKQMIIFTNLQNDLSVTDNNNPLSIFVHTDREDDADSPYDKIPVLTDFVPTIALNIPLENCEDSMTLFYKLKDEQRSDVYYPTYNCGGHDHQNIVEVERFNLTKPAVLRINVPHGVHNPNSQPRTVATFRFQENLEYFFKN